MNYSSKSVLRLSRNTPLGHQSFAEGMATLLNREFQIEMQIKRMFPELLQLGRWGLGSLPKAQSNRNQ